ncbi:MAG: ATP-dependent helicase HrpA [Actinomycetota bacterium]
MSAPPTPRRQRSAAAIATLENLAASGRIAPAPGLPLAERWDDVVDAIRDHQVVVVAGETGSGKSTQLPKACIAAGRGANGLIGHTQPRRVAARTIAERIAEELGVDVGAAVGFAVRFTDRVGDDTVIKVMTDGILLAEIQRDPTLRRYDTIIIDEAHERSLNIDFLLGYLRRLIEQRPDLHIVITSATIDTERFAAHFADAPIITVSGRTYPVEVRYRPFGVDDDRDQVQAVSDAIDELADAGPGDVLVFLSGEREIHDVADHLRRRQLVGTDILPLYARLSAAEQHRIFQPHPGRRIVLSTNVAETSLTVPGVRFVVDAGAARISRYSHRLKVQRLPIEPVSQASANQRAGRCGRVAPGICIRLYAEDDFVARPEFTEPEILRTNLASVILQMTALRLGDVAQFPFLDPPDARAVRDGYALLDELGALSPQGGPDQGGPDQARSGGQPGLTEPRLTEPGLTEPRLTELGRRLARLPVDPRLGRMVLEADRHGCVREVLVIASALSIQDPRERPTEHREAADELHRRFVTDGSDFLAYVRLWDHLRARQQELSSSQFRKLCRSEHLNYVRVREWQDLFSQLRQVAGSIGIHHGSDTAHPDRVHQALLAGLLSHLGQRNGTTREYRGAHGSTFALARSSATSKQLPRWVMAGELVETNRLWGRTVAPVQPEWAEQLGRHLTRSSYGEPRWDAARGGAVVTERVSLFGLPIVSGRAVGLDRIDRALARDMFIRHALVEGDADRLAERKLLDTNRDLVDEVRRMGARVRRIDLVDDDVVARFYDTRLPADVVTVRHFDRWVRRSGAEARRQLTMTIDDLLGGRSDVDLDDFPGTWEQDDLEFDVVYRFDPGADDDGVNVMIPVEVLNRVRPTGFDWSVPGVRDDLVGSLVKSLPKEYRRELSPLADITSTAAAAVRATRADRRAEAPSESFLAALGRTLTEASGVIVPEDVFQTDRVAPHLRVTFCVIGADGTVLAHGTDLGVLRRSLGRHVRASLMRAMPLQERDGIVSWDVGDLPQRLEADRTVRSPTTGLHRAVTVVGHPALVDEGDSVSLRILSNPDLQARLMRGGVRRLLLLSVPVPRRVAEQSLTNAHRLALSRCGLDLADVVADCTAAVADRLIIESGGPPWSEAAFSELTARAKTDLAGRTASAVRTVGEIAVEAVRVGGLLERLIAPSIVEAADDARAHLGRLVHPGFIPAAGVKRLADVRRYVEALRHRLEKLPEHPARDRQHLTHVRAIETRYSRLLGRFEPSAVPADVVDLGWTLEELRVALFAQSLSPGGVSAQRVARRLTELGG